VFSELSRINSDLVQIASSEHEPQSKQTKTTKPQREKIPKKYSKSLLKSFNQTFLHFHSPILRISHTEHDLGQQRFLGKRRDFGVKIRLNGSRSCAKKPDV
jgi:hypothetical protein